MEINPSFWRACSSCKKNINYSSKYYECNVSTCTGKRTGYVFCTVACWEAHLPQARHRDAWAVEKQSPSLAQARQELSLEAPSSGARRIIVPSSPSKTSETAHEVLVVVSKMKQYIKDKADMNTSGEVSDLISDLIRQACDDAIDQARADGRKTVMGRDFKSRS